MKRLLIVVDCQKDFIDGALGFEGADAIIPGIVERIAGYKSAGDEVVYTMDTHTADYMNTQEGRNLPVPHCIKGSEGYKLTPALEEPLSGCKGFDKPTFGSVDLAEYIKEQGDATEVTLLGICTDICVISNAMLIKAYFPEISVSVVESCCAGVTKGSSDNALKAMQCCHIQINNF